MHVDVCTCMHEHICKCIYMYADVMKHVLCFVCKTRMHVSLYVQAHMRTHMCDHAKDEADPSTNTGQDVEHLSSLRPGTSKASRHHPRDKPSITTLYEKGPSRGRKCVRCGRHCYQRHRYNQHMYTDTAPSCHLLGLSEVRLASLNHISENSRFGHLGSLTAANWVSFDFNVAYSSR